MTIKVKAEVTCDLCGDVNTFEVDQVFDCENLLTGRLMHRGWRAVFGRWSCKACANRIEAVLVSAREGLAALDKAIMEERR